MKILGVTGSMGMGKSTVCALFHNYGFPVFDADRVVHQLQAPHGKGLKKIEQTFPGAVKNNALDRNYLRHLIVQDRNNLKKIEQIILPMVAQERDKFIRLAQARGIKWCMLDVPLLFEKKINLLCTKTLVVAAPVNIQKIRILKRNKITWEQARAFIDAQIPSRTKCKMADIVIQTGLSKAHTFFQVKKIIRLMQAGQL
ncbi:Dephospho-CoA kinase (CoaE) (PDB:1JJV) [Commensalibacter communis]|uniref:dephospho-CoA kinase n=1 Tax=Commensalibacter communis TaxID=2972786 RepID=UPI0022FF6363|nr:dephospho-CoA kinase [Commensalibacter communis]CAI3936145.1 Dephospho-CoA kinase (CoaE) (PDB:1JJV) [Commensalibacter communis]